MAKLPDHLEMWTCDHCTAACTFEAMEWCAKRFNPDAECGYDYDQPLALDEQGTASREGCFEFVQLRVGHRNRLNDTMETRKP